MSIPVYPEFKNIDADDRPELHPNLVHIRHGVSEFSFAGLYLFRNTYKYELAWLPDKKLLVRGQKEGKTFYSLPHGFPKDQDLCATLLHESDYFKGISENHADTSRVWLEQQGYSVCEDRDNFDYLYLREDLATLPGRKYHKKRNQVNAFINNYNYEERPMDDSNLSDAYYILEKWRSSREDDGDYAASKEALELHEFLDLKGYLVYVDGKPAAYTMGESIAKGRTFVIHMEKAIGSYKGIYQFINQAFAAVLPRSHKFINREQDLGDMGLRQSKMTYRPCGFVKKYRVCPIGSIKVPFHTILENEGQRTR